MTFTPGLVAVLAALTVFLTLYAIFAPINAIKKDKIEDEIFGEKEEAEATDSLGKYAKPLINNFLPQLPIKALSPQTRNKLSNFMIKSGNPWKLSPEEYVGILIVFAAIGLFLGLITAVFNLIPIPLFLLVMITTLMGLAIPYSTYNSKRIARTNEIQKQLPEALDLLVVTLTAGQPFEAALNQVVPQIPPGLLKEELTRINMQIRAGTTLERALTNFSKVIDSEEVESFTKAIIQAQRLGSDITETLTHQAIFVRNNHEARVQQMIARLSTTMFIPLAGTMLPAFLIIFLAPSLSSLGGLL